METNKRNQHSYKNENESWDQNQGRQNDYNRSRNAQSTYGDYNYGQNRQSDYRNRDNQNDWNNSGNQNNRWQNSDRFRDGENGEYFRNMQNEGYRHRDDRDFGNQGSYQNRNFGNRDYDDQRGYGSFNREYNQGNNAGMQNRNWVDKTRDEVSSWFGDDDAEQRRREDKQRNGQHKGKGPKDYQRSSDRIREDISDRLSDDSYIDASEIEIKVTGNEVTLSGTVDSKEAKRRAEDLAEAVSGVANVQNQLRVTQLNQSGNSAGQAKTQANTNLHKQDKERHN